MVEYSWTITKKINHLSPNCPNSPLPTPHSPLPPSEFPSDGAAMQGRRHSLSDLAVHEPDGLGWDMLGFAFPNAWRKLRTKNIK